MLRTEIGALHPGVDKDLGRRLDDAFDQLVARSERLPRHRAIVELARIVAGVGDGHTNLWLTPNADNGFHQTPILLYALDGELFVLGIASDEVGALGARLLAVEGSPTAEALAQVEQLVSHDNRMGQLAVAPRYLAIPEVLEAVGLLSDLARVHYTAETAAGERLEIALPALPRDAVPNLSARPYLIRTGSEGLPFSLVYDEDHPPLWLRAPELPYWYQSLAESGALYVQINALANGADEGFAAFREGLFARIDAHPPSRLVLDLRHNGGGNNRLALPLVLGLVRRSALDRPGHLFVLIGRHTYSAASYLVTALESLTEAVFVGEPTGSSPNHYGDSIPVRLTWLGVSVNVATVYWQNSLPSRWEKRDRTAPAVAVTPSIEDLRRGLDPVLEAALAWTAQPSLLERLEAALDQGGTADVGAVAAAFSADPRNRYLDPARDLNVLGYSLLRRQRVAEAVAVLRVATELRPDSPNAHDSLGEALLAAGQSDAARTAWQRALELDPDFSASRANLTRLEGQE